MTHPHPSWDRAVSSGATLGKPFMKTEAVLSSFPTVTVGFARTQTHRHFWECFEITHSRWQLYFAPVLVLVQRGAPLLNHCDLGLSGHLAKHQFL